MFYEIIQSAGSVQFVVVVSLIQWLLCFFFHASNNHLEHIALDQAAESGIRSSSKEGEARTSLNSFLAVVVPPMLQVFLHRKCC